DKINAARFAQMIRLDDIGVDQVGYEFGFANKIINELLLVCVILANHFDSNAFDEAARAQLLGFVHHAHPALKDLANDLVMKLVLHGKQGHDAMVIESARLSSPPFATISRIAWTSIFPEHFRIFSLRHFNETL